MQPEAAGEAMKETEKIQVTVNGEPRTIAAGSSIVDMLQQLGVDGQRVAVELNRSIVRKGEWSATLVEAGSQIEIVEFVGGGRARGREIHSN
jgi:sulfur carrier protein